MSENDIEPTPPPLDEVARELGNGLLTIATLVAKARRRVSPNQRVLEDIDEVLTDCVSLTRQLSTRLHATERSLAIAAAAAVQDDRSSVRIEVCGVADELHSRVAHVLHGIVDAFGGAVEVQAPSRSGAAVIVRLTRAT